MFCQSVNFDYLVDRVLKWSDFDYEIFEWSLAAFPSANRSWTTK